MSGANPQPAAPAAGPFTGAFQGLAHRGGGLEQFENSPSAFQHAAALGYRYIETDLQASKDGVLYLFHDDDLARCSTGNGRFSDHGSEAIDRLRLKNGEAIPRLADILARYPDITLNADVKTDACIQPVTEFLQSSPHRARLVLASFSTRRLRAIRQAVKDIRSDIMRPDMSMADMSIANLHMTGGQADIAALYAGQWIGALRPPPICAAQIPPRHYGIELATPRFIRHCHAHHIKIHVWTINDPEEMRRLIRLGVDGICTDRPTILREVLAEFDLTP